MHPSVCDRCHLPCMHTSPKRLDMVVHALLVELMASSCSPGRNLLAALANILGLVHRVIITGLIRTIRLSPSSAPRPAWVSISKVNIA